MTELKIPYSVSIPEDKMKPLIGDKVLYPDGTINSLVRNYLRERGLKLFEAKPKKPIKKPWLKILASAALLHNMPVGSKRYQL